MWRELLTSIIFALNTSESADTKCAPYQVVYGGEPTFPTDTLLTTVLLPSSAVEYIKNLNIQI